MRKPNDRFRRSITNLELVMAVVLVALLAGFALLRISLAQFRIDLALLGLGAALFGASRMVMPEQRDDILRREGRWPIERHYDAINYQLSDLD